ncbi:MAG: EAL domain-containing response regulator [Nitrospinae bacterium]|nr:EAL domain-containing response regulator [Nitrospinota bacterium]
MSAPDTPRRLLVVDDEPSMVELVAEVAMGAGYEVVTLSDPTGFEATYDNGVFDVLVLDLMMPGRDGVEIMRYLGGLPQTPKLVLMSGYDDAVLNTARELAVAHGLNVIGHLSKPFRVGQLAQTLEAAQAAPGPRRSQQAAPAPSAYDEIAGGIERREFLYHYQPQIHLQTGGVVGFEALARWESPTRGMVPPLHFIESAEGYDLIDRLTWALLDRGIVELNTLDGWSPGATLSVNISHHSLSDLAFPDTLHERIRNLNVDPARIIVEITETGVMKNMRLSLDIIARFRMKGFKMSIDDFGIGSAMYEQLARLPITELKIDQSFVGAYFQSRKARAIVENSISLGHDLGLHVVAEGVETAEISDALREAGCDIGQGYYYAKPLSLNDMASWFHETSSDDRSTPNGPPRTSST